MMRRTSMNWQKFERYTHLIIIFLWVSMNLNGYLPHPKFDFGGTNRDQSEHCTVPNQCIEMLVCIWFASVSLGWLHKVKWPYSLR
jgi:hypothetical protein